MTISTRHASETLLEELAQAPGTVTVRKQRAESSWSQPELLVIAYLGSQLTRETVPLEYCGYRVNFEKRSVPRAGNACSL